MFKTALNKVKSFDNNIIHYQFLIRLHFRKHFVMEGVNKLKIENDLAIHVLPAKKMKITSEIKIIKQRTVGTMCGAWRPDEEYGGLVLVFPKRELCLSPDPPEEKDLPENIADFWEEIPSSSSDDQVSFLSKIDLSM